MKITILSDSPMLPTGYANQSRQLAEFLANKGHEIHYLANAYAGATMKKVILEDGTIFDYKIYGHFGTNPYFMQTISKHLKETNSDRLIILLDTFMLYQSGFMNVDTSPAKTFFWYPSDGGGGLPKNCELVLKKIDVPVAMAKFGQKQVKDYYDLETEHIPHGVDSKRFYRLPDDQREELRRKWGFHDKFVIGVVARNQPRKNLDRTIKMMSLLKDRIPNAILFLHLDPNDPAQQVFNIHELAKHYNIENRIVYSGMSAHKGWPESEMNNVYNLMDVFFLSTSGEGFGIPIIEAMSCEVPVLATSYTTTHELVEENKSGIGIKLSGTDIMPFFEIHSREYDKALFNGTITGSWSVERGICSITDAVEQLEYVYKNPDKAKIMGQNGRKAVLEKYDFKTKVGPLWEKIIK